MRILFYLPVITPWWFENVVEPLLRRAATIAEVHVLAPKPWRNTGIGPDQIARCFDLTRLTWAIADGPDHPSLRTQPADPGGLIDYVTELAPDLTLCRTADFDTARLFPGTVRFLMEAAAAPFAMPACTTTITADPFVNGALPLLSPGEREPLERLIAPLWSEMRSHWAAAIPSRTELLAAAGIPDDRPVLLLPLEYEHEENFFLQHRVGPPRNVELLAEIAGRVAGRCSLVVTNHPLNSLYLDSSELEQVVERLGPRVVLSGSRICDVPASLALAAHVDGMILGDSKTFGLAASFGVPIMRRSRFASADWLNAESDLDRFVAAVAEGQARAPAEDDARLWFAYHLGNEAFHPQDPDLDGAMVFDRATRLVGPERWESAIARVRAVKEEFVQ